LPSGYVFWRGKKPWVFEQILPSDLSGWMAPHVNHLESADSPENGLFLAQKGFIAAFACFRYPQSIFRYYHRCSLPGLAGFIIAKNLRGQKLIAKRNGLLRLSQPLSGLRFQHEAGFW